MTATIDPIDALQEEAKRVRLEDQAAKAMKKAIVQLVLGKDAKSAFFATLAYKLKLGPVWDIPTAATDGKRLVYNPEFIMSLSEPAQIGLLVHEIAHCILDHQGRRQGREPKAFNIAADIALNPLVKESGFTLPDGALFPGQGPFKDLPPGKSAEWYYEQLPKNGKGGGQPGQPGYGEGNDPGKCGGVMDSGDEAQQKQNQAEWQVSVSQAANAAKKRGTLPGGLSRIVEELLTPENRWQDELSDFVSNVFDARDDYSWSRPNRRFLSSGLYLPSLRSESLGSFVVAIDTSGSVGKDELALFVGHLNAILECRPAKVHVLYCDAQVHRADEWNPSDGPMVVSDAPGGGGTEHSPIWDWIKDNDVEPEAVICLTDGYTSWGKDPGVPVLWAMTTDVKAPFGRTIRIEAE